MLNNIKLIPALCGLLLLSSSLLAKDPAPVDLVSVATSSLFSLYSGDFPMAQANFAQNFTDFDTVNADLHGFDRMAKFASEIRAAIPDALYQATASYQSGSMVFIFGRILGTQIGPFRNTVPVGREVSLSTFDMFEFEEGLIKSHRSVKDLLPLYALSDPNSGANHSATSNQILNATAEGKILGKLAAPTVPLPEGKVKNKKNLKSENKSGSTTGSSSSK